MNKYIGREIESQDEDDYKIHPSEVSFRWQIGLKIGSGRFGIVYSAVNLDTGSIMALKIIYLHKITKKTESEKVDFVADEINNVIKIDQENLVKVYGAELNKVCMIFLLYSKLKFRF
jgi:mitogen-activated protein kinase kinase kinase